MDTKMKTMNESYFCTWNVQGEVAQKNAKAKEAGEIMFEGDQGALCSRDAICEETVFGKDGWIHYYPEIRKDIYFLLDDGWDVDYNTLPPEDFPKFGSHVVNEQRFPSFKGSPEEKLKAFADRVKAAGWKGLGLWVPAQAYGADWEKSVKEAEAYWRAMLERSKYAGVGYWKVDWGKCAHTSADRKAISALAKEIYPELVVEHAICMWLINDKSSPNGRFANDKACKMGIAFAEYSDVLRTYDHSQLGISTTLDRVACVLPNSNALINCESYGYMAAGLGFSIGIMSAPQSENGRENLAAIKWHRIAPPFVGGETHLSSNELTDYFDFTEGSTWATGLIGRRIYQTAPAVIARNTPLPQVTCDGEVPFVVASMNPSGAYSVAELGRLLGTELPLKADVICPIASNPANIGVFGNFASITFKLNTAPTTVKMRNLITDDVIDISADLILDKNLRITDNALYKLADPNKTEKLALQLLLSY